MSYCIQPACQCNPLNHIYGEERKRTNTEGEFPPSCCIPCGKLAYPKKTQKMEHIIKLEKKPLFDMLEEDRKMALRIEVENHAHARKIVDNAKFKTKMWLEEEAINLEARRDKLTLLLQDDDEMFKMQMIEKFESRQSNRIEEMRAKVAQLKEKREIHHKKFVEKKLDLAFQTQCEQMRTLLSKRMTQEIAVDRNEQLRQKRRLECEAEDEERMWAYLWNKDAEEKWKREQAYQCVRDEATRRGVEELNKQKEYKELRKADISKIMAREAAIIQADRDAMFAEQKKWVEEKEARFLKAKTHAQDMMATRDYYRDKRVKREEIVAREFLKRAVRELYIEQEDRGIKKRELMRAIQIYRKYLQERDCLENAKEEALQRIIDGVIEEQHKKVNASRTLEVKQRKELYESVMAGRALQVEDLNRKRDQEEIDRQNHATSLKLDWTRYLHEVEMENQERENKRLQYRNDLDCQVIYNEKVAERENAEKRREDELCSIEERLFNHRLQKMLDKASLSMSNQYREPFVGKYIKQCLIPVPPCKPCD